MKTTIPKYLFLLFFATLLLCGCKNLNILSQNQLDKLYPSENIKIKYHNEWAIKHYPKRIKEFKQTPLNFGDIVFIGNSITESGNDWSAKLNIPNIKNRGISGDIADGILKRLDEITHFKPKMIFLLVGINDLRNLIYQNEIPSVEYIANNIIKITELIHKDSPSTKIFVQTVLPTTDLLLKPSIDKVNSVIKSQKKLRHYEVIDLHTLFLDSSGLLKQELTHDGLHLNEEGYKLWVSILKPYFTHN